MPKINLKYGVNEIQLDGSDEFVKQQLDKFYSIILNTSVTSGLKQQLLVEKKPSTVGKVPSPAEFYKSKGKTDYGSQLLIFGKYLEQYRNITQFSRSDINAVAAEAKVSKDVHSQYFTNAVKQGLLRALPKGKYSITLTGEEIIASMQE